MLFNQCTGSEVADFTEYAYKEASVTIRAAWNEIRDDYMSSTEL